MFISAMQRLEQEGIKVNAVRGAWFGGTDSVNTSEYLADSEKGMLPAEAAAKTWTGRIAAKYGFTNVQTSVKERWNDATTVIFERP
ncbi:hypothetical protein V2J84_16505 [Pseudomonas alliivorans]|nr:hypothetical protein [Pseudomonas alliivorans]